MGNLHIFKSSYSKGYFLTTVLLVVLFIYIIIGLSRQLAEVAMGSGRFYWLAFSVVLFSYLLIFSFLSQIVSVNVDDERVIIQKMLGQIILQRNEIVSVEDAPANKSNMNLFALCGLFGTIGWVRNGELGVVFSLVKDDSKRVIIRTRRKCYMVSCDRKEDLLALLSRSAR